MKVLKAHFDGKVFVPDEPVNVPADCAVELYVQPLNGNPAEAKQPATPDDERPLMKLIQALEELPDNPDWPPDGAAQHDHYLYGLPKRS